MKLYHMQQAVEIHWYNIKQESFQLKGTSSAIDSIAGHLI